MSPPCPGQHRQTLVQAAEQLARREHLDLGRQLDRKRKIVEPPADLREAGVVGGEPREDTLGAPAEELDRRRLGERPRGTRVGDPQRLAARDDEAEIGRRAQEPGDLRRDTDHLLEVVQDQEQLTVAELRDGVALSPEGLRDVRKDERRLADRRQLHEADPILERLDELGGGRDGGLVLPIPPGP